MFQRARLPFVVAVVIANSTSLMVLLTVPLFMRPLETKGSAHIALGNQDKQ